VKAAKTGNCTVRGIEISDVFWEGECVLY